LEGIQLLQLSAWPFWTWVILRYGKLVWLEGFR
jgi:hypothetical protein